MPCGQSRHVISEHQVGTVAIGLIVSVLAAANVECACVIHRKTHRLDACVLVRTIAERLVLRAPASAIKVRLTFSELNLVRALLSDNGLFSHTHLHLCALSSSFQLRRGGSGTSSLPGSDEPDKSGRLAVPQSVFESNCGL